MFRAGVLHEIFGSALGKVLEALIHSDGLTVRQVARVTELAPSTASVALRALEVRGLVRGVAIGTALQFWLNESHFAVPHLQELVKAADQIRREFPQILESALGSEPRCVMLFGSVARGDATGDSDMDLLVVAHDAAELQRWQARVNDLGGWLSSRIGGPWDVIIVESPSKTELRRPFWRNVLREGRLLAGEPLERG